MDMDIPRKLAGRRAASHSTARALGWFSIGLGLAELLAPRTLARFLGIEGREGLLRAYGAREIATGIGILNSSNPAPWLWGRVAGDALDIASLGKALAGSEKTGGVTAALGALAGVTLADVATAQILSELEHKDRTYYRDYSTRSGFFRSVDALRGTVREVRGPRSEAARPGARPASPLNATS
jgi:hypothetical protein